MFTLTQPTPLYDFIDELQGAGFVQPALWLQVAVILMCAALAWFLGRLLVGRLRHEQFGDHWRFGSEGISRVMVPTLFWFGVEVITPFWRAGHPITLLRLAASLGFAFVLVRVAVYLLRTVFVQAVWVARYERAIAGLIWILFALHLSGLLPEFADALDGVVLPLGKQHVSVLTLVNGVFSIAVTLLIALWIGRLFEQRLMGIESLDLSLRVVVNKIVRTVLIVVAVLIALPLVGIDLTVLSVFGGAVGVGLGFGLQKVASNYVSGFIILLDGSIRIGDLVSIDGRQGTISKITSRYVLLKLSDGSEAIIPNEALITSTVLNLSHTDRLSYITLPVRVAYGTDLDAVRTLLSAILSGQPRVLAEPMPQVFVKGLAESGIDLELGFWIGDLQSGVTGLRSDLYLLIWRAFNEQGIEIPYPRRDLYLIGEPGKVDPNQSSSAR